MLKSYIPSEIKEIIEYELVFDDGHNNGFGFPCDERGNVFPLEYEAARSNLKWCLENPDQFERYNEVVRNRRKVREPAHGTCACGREVYLVNEYYGTCQCQKCGSWYNLFGQEMLPPEQWETDPSEEEYW